MNSTEYTEAINREGVAYNEIVRLSELHLQWAREGIATRDDLSLVSTSAALCSVFIEKSTNLLREWYGSISVPSHVDDITKENLREAHLILLKRTIDDARIEVLNWLKGEFNIPDQFTAVIDFETPTITAVQRSTEIADAVDRVHSIHEVDHNGNPINKEEVPATEDRTENGLSEADESQVNDFMADLAKGVRDHIFGSRPQTFLRITPDTGA